MDPERSQLRERLFCVLISPVTDSGHPPDGRQGLFPRPEEAAPLLGPPHLAGAC